MVYRGLEISTKGEIHGAGHTRLPNRVPEHNHKNHRRIHFVRQGEHRCQQAGFGPVCQQRYEFYRHGGCFVQRQRGQDPVHQQRAHCMGRTRRGITAPHVLIRPRRWLTARPNQVTSLWNFSNVRMLLTLNVRQAESAGSVFLSKPVKTFPGPTSTTISTSVAINVCMQSYQRTGRKSCSAMRALIAAGSTAVSAVTFNISVRRGVSKGMADKKLWLLENFSGFLSSNENIKIYK